MKFIDQYQQLRGLFSLTKSRINIPESQVRIENMEFQSEFEMPVQNETAITDYTIKENIRFTYPVFMPKSKTRTNRVIIYLHGLNERSWDKHLAGGKYLCEKTGYAVLLFPLSFHINRGLPEWNDVRRMASLLDARRRKYPGVKDSTLANLALSERLTDQPKRFLISGLQSMQDLTELMKTIRQGDHPLFEAGAEVDLFGYSIGCMLLQALMENNPDHLLDRSRIVFFAGGSLFDHMKGISRYIMDSVAFASIHQYYLHHFGIRDQQESAIKPLLPEQKKNKDFRSFFSSGIESKGRITAMKNFGKNLMVIALRDDLVMPLEGIRMAVGDRFFRSENFRILHFPYRYIHENPFPVLYRKIDEQVNQAFESVFTPAMQFFLDKR